MIENFDKALEWLLEHEGGYSNYDDDPETNLGVTIGVYEEFIGRKCEPDEMKSLKVEYVSPLYKKAYWDKIRGDDLPSGVDNFVFDFQVNAGSRSSKILQKVVGVTQDGGIGPQTLVAVADNEPRFIIESMYTHRQKFYEGLDKFAKYGRGWTTRNKLAREQSLSLL